MVAGGEEEATVEPSRRRRRPPLVTRDQAVQAAYQLIAADGPQGLSMRKLAAVLHVSLPTVYTAIRSKEQLVGELQGRLLTEISATLADDEEREPRDRLLAIGEALFDWADEHPQLAAFLLEEDPSREHSARAVDSASEPGRTAVVEVVSGLVGQDVANLDATIGVLFASAVSRAVLSLARSGLAVERRRWLDIWADSITSGLRRLANPGVVLT